MKLGYRESSRIENRPTSTIANIIPIIRGYRFRYGISCICDRKVFRSLGEISVLSTVTELTCARTPTSIMRVFPSNLPINRPAPRPNACKYRYPIWGFYTTFPRERDVLLAFTAPGFGRNITKFPTRSLSTHLPNDGIVSENIDTTKRSVWRAKKNRLRHARNISPPDPIKVKRGKR